MTSSAYSSSTSRKNSSNSNSSVFELYKNKKQQQQKHQQQRISTSDFSSSFTNSLNSTSQQPTPTTTATNSASFAALSQQQQTRRMSAAASPFGLADPTGVKMVALEQQTNLLKAKRAISTRTATTSNLIHHQYNQQLGYTKKFSIPTAETSPRFSPRILPSTPPRRYSVEACNGSSQRFWVPPGIAEKPRCSLPNTSVVELNEILKLREHLANELAGNFCCF